MTNIGPYKILEEVGRGGMATVFRAYQSTTDRFVALKVIHQNIQADDTAMRRFQREAHLIARLEHPHIVPIHDFDGTHAPPYIVMRYMEHGTLEHILALGRIPLDKAIGMMKQIISAVDYAHRQGIVHRDIKPSNILMDSEGNAFVTDFGIARLTDQYVGKPGTTITDSGFAVGTPDYMSPEQARGERDVDQRADVYALGGLIFHMITGQKPYAGSNAVEVIIKHVNYPVPSILSVDPNLSPELDTIIRKAMAKDARDRFQTAAALGTVLERLRYNAENGVTQPQLPPPHDSMYEAFSHATQEAVVVRLDDDSRPSNPIRITEHKRVVTVVCLNALDYADLVAEQNGDVDQALDELWEAATSVVQEMGGTVITRESAMLLALWSIQVAQRTDPEYAVRASMWIQKALTDIGATYLQANPKRDRIPLNIGVTIGGVLSKYDANQTLQFDLSGSTISLAMWLAQYAEGRILVSHEIFLATRNAYEFEAGPPVKANGRKDPYQSYRVREAKALRSTQETSANPTEASTAEINTLVQSYRQVAQNRRPMVVNVQSGNISIKSRLLDEFFNWVRIQNEQPYLFRGFSTPPEKRQYHYTLLRSMFQVALNISENERESHVQYQLEQGIAQMIDVQSRAVAHFIGYLIGYNIPDSPHLSRFYHNADQLEQLAQESCLHFFIKLAEDKTLIILIEDMQWADIKSVNLLNKLVVENPTLPILVICRVVEESAPASNTQVTSYQTRPTEVFGETDDTTMNLPNQP